MAAGNELEVAKLLVRNRGIACLNHLGVIEEVGAPIKQTRRYIEIQDENSVSLLVDQNDPSKKADMYVNGFGISVKQAGGSFGFNRLQRVNTLSLFNSLNLQSPSNILGSIDHAIGDYHENSETQKRNRNWSNFFTEPDFKKLARHLMTVASPRLGISRHPADYILEAPKEVSEIDEIRVFTFDEYFTAYEHKLVIALRRSWFGQDSNTEHGRARSIMKKSGNAPWVFDTVSGEPEGWRAGFPESEKRTCYYLMIEKLK